MQYPRVLTRTDIKCGEKRCGAIFFKVPEGPPFIIECGRKECRKFVRGATQEDAERLWAEKINRLPNSEE